MTTLIKVPVTTKTDLENLAEALATEMGVALKETVNGLNPFSSIYEKSREASGKIFYQLMCSHDRDPMQIDEEQSRELILEKIAEGVFDESLAVDYEGAHVTVSRKPGDVYFFMQNQAFIERSKSYPYKMPGFDLVEEAVRGIL